MTITRDTTKYDETMLHDAELWTQIDGDFEGVDPKIAAAILHSRCETIKYDYARTAYWHDPESIDAYCDIAYLPDGGNDEGEVRGHLLDIYLPHDAVVRNSRTTPVYIDIHGGGFVYGYKELNRNFNTHLTACGFAVVSLNYRPAPQATLRGQLEDVQAALRWLGKHLSEYPVDASSLFITGDSAGGALALLTLAIESNPKAALAFGIEQASGTKFKGGALVCGVYSLASAERTAASSDYDPVWRANLENVVGTEFFEGLESADPMFLTPAGIVANCELPPLYIQTSSDDFLQADSLALATALARHNADFEIHDWKVGKAQSLGHVFVVGMTWLDESKQILEEIRKFSYSRL